MRPFVVVPILCVSVSAWAGKGGGGDGGGGALGHVSAGISSATHSSGGGGGHPSGGSSSGGSGGGGNVDTTRPPVAETEIVYIGGTPVLSPVAPAPPGPNDGAHIDVYAGVQKVHDSNGSWSLSLAVVDRWFRVQGALTNYFEDQMSGDPLTMTMPSLVLGVRIDDHRATKVYLDVGVVGAYTKNDPVADSTLRGGLGGATVEHALSPRLWLLADAHRMFFDHGVRANQLRAGVRISWFEASIRMLDFNVGPPLYGPEIGLRF